MKKWVLLLLIIGLSSFGVTLSASAAVKQTVSQKKGGSLLFVVYANTGSLSRLNDGSYRLVMHVADQQGVTEFSDRPVRYAKRISFSQFGHIAESGEQSFMRVFPNAALTAANRSPVVFIIQKGSYKKNQATFILKLIDSKQRPVSGSLQAVSLFIDNVDDCIGADSVVISVKQCQATESACVAKGGSDCATQLESCIAGSLE